MAARVRTRCNNAVQQRTYPYLDDRAVPGHMPLFVKRFAVAAATHGFQLSLLTTPLTCSAHTCMQSIHSPAVDARVCM